MRAVVSAQARRPTRAGHDLRGCRLTTLVALWFLAPTALSLAGKFEKAMDAMGRGAFDVAAPLLERLAGDGDPRAQLELGRALEHGTAKLVDWGSAADWYREAAKKDHPEAQAELASLILRAREDPSRRTLAVWKPSMEEATWFRACADRGNADCQALLGFMFAEGWLVDRDVAAAIPLLRRAAGQWHEHAGLRLARLYLDGAAGDRDPHAAIAVLEQFADKGWREANLELARLHLAGDGAGRDLVRAYTLAARASLVAGSRDVLDQILETADEKQLQAMTSEVLKLFDSGEYTSAVLGAQPLAYRGVPAAQFIMGQMQAQAYGTPKNLAASYHWLTLGQSFDPPKAKRMLLKVARELSPAGVDAVSEFVARTRPVPWQPADLKAERAFLSQDGTRAPRLLWRVEPVYPKRSISGRAVLHVTIDKEGWIIEPYVVKCSPPSKGFEDAALEAVRQWRYSPASQKGLYRDAPITIVVVFDSR